jgi:(p)ppGpp synthase/HD superfamily hydrolase
MNLIDQAVEFAAYAHREQKRKGTEIPYISHPFAVGMILQQAGCEEEVVAAGILHDTLEDTELKHASLRIRLVACADKLHNIRSIKNDLERVGEDAWTRFNRGREIQQWYYTGLVYPDMSVLRGWMKISFESRERMSHSSIT